MTDALWTVPGSVSGYFWGARAKPLRTDHNILNDITVALSNLPVPPDVSQSIANAFLDTWPCVKVVVVPGMSKHLMQTMSFVSFVETAARRRLVTYGLHVNAS